jgi:hypothetical protein
MSAHHRTTAPPRRLALPVLALAALCALLAACSSCPPTAAAGQPNSVLPGNPEPTSGPYVVTAIDNHFHDIHPEDRNVIHEDQPFVVKNVGANLHNFTVIGTQISIDLKPGQSFEWPTIGSKLKPATWVVVCKYHAYLGMIGMFTVAP